jgi:CheY-like chemotaxis protein
LAIQNRRRTSKVKSGVGDKIVIVLVEDEGLTLAWMYNEFRQAFANAEIQTYRTESAFLKAVPAFARNPPALIVMDVMLRWNDQEAPSFPPPGEGYRAGLRCQRALEQHEGTKRVPMIFYTALEASAIEKGMPSSRHHTVVVKKGTSPESLITVARGLVSVKTRLDPPVMQERLLRVARERVFVILSFTDHLSDTYETIRRGVTKAGRRFEVVRSGLAPGSYYVTGQIEQSLRDARLIVCDLSYDKPNVYYELGYARALGKELICVAKSGARLHFDVAHIRTLFYDSFTELEDLIRKEIVALSRPRGGR